MDTKQQIPHSLTLSMFPVPPQPPPAVTFPNGIQSDITVTLTCHATFLIDTGELFWSTKAPGQSDFVRNDFADNAQTVQTQTCTRQLTNTLTTPFSMAMNGTEIRCESTAPDDVSTSKTLLIVPCKLLLMMMVMMMMVCIFGRIR